MSPNLGKKEEQRRARGKEGEIRQEQSNHGGEIIKTKAITIYFTTLVGFVIH